MTTDKTPTFAVDFSVPETEDFWLPAVLDSKAVLQQNATVKIWGRYPEAGPVAAEVNGKLYYGTCADGRFEIFVETGAASKGNTLTLYSKTGKRTIRDVWFGEVFLCSGQSNMQLPLSYAEAPTQEELKIAAANLRMAHVPLPMMEKPAEDVFEDADSPWQDITPEILPYLSSTGFYFGVKMQAELGVPVGIVVSAAGDTIIASWLAPEDAAKIPNHYQEERPDYWLRTASHMYRVLLYPVLNYCFKGVVWYQGENQSLQYDEFLTLLIESWRRYFGRPDLGFVVIELVGCDLPWIYRWPEIRRQQRKVCETVPGCALTVGVDLGEADEIHPKDKRAVGTRAAFAALNLWYGRRIPQSPVLRSAKRAGNEIELRFEPAQGLRLIRGGTGFEASADGETFFEARARREGERIFVSCEAVPNPTHVRYLWRNFPRPMVSVYGEGDLPADAFWVKVESDS